MGGDTVCDLGESDVVLHGNIWVAIVVALGCPVRFFWRGKGVSTVRFVCLPPLLSLSRCFTDAILVDAGVLVITLFPPFALSPVSVFTSHLFVSFLGPGRDPCD